MNTRKLGLVAIAGSPFLGIDFLVNNFDQNYQPSALSGIFSLLYMTGWMCSIVGLFRLKAAGEGSIGKGILITQLALLSLAQMWNIYLIIAPSATSLLFKTLDHFWPLSNCFMLITGLAIIRAKKLHGWKRFVPLVVGLWLPICLVLISILFGANRMTLYISAFYSAMAWLLLGLTVYFKAGEREISDLLAPVLKDIA